MFSQIVRVAQILSLDVALAALAGGILAERTIHSGVPLSFFLLLPLSVWVVYTLDHLLDGRRMGPNAQTARHRFHYLHRKVLTSCCLIAAMGCIGLAFIALSWLGILFGLAMGCGVLLHLGIVKLAGGTASPLLMKEVGVAAIFTAGVWGLPILRHHRLDWPVVLVVQYFLLALVNLLEFALFDIDADRADRQTSFVQGIGPRWGRRAALACLLTVSGTAVVVLSARPNAEMAITQACYLIMAVMLASLLLFPQWMSKNERYRAIGDGAFIVPIVRVLM